MVLNLFFSEHITKSSLKDLKYTAFVSKLKLSEEKEKIENEISRHVSSSEFHGALERKDFSKVNAFIDNWMLLAKIDQVVLYDSNGVLVDLRKGQSSVDGARLSQKSLNELKFGYVKTSFVASKDGFLINARRKIINENGEIKGYLSEDKKYSYNSFLGDEPNRGLIVTSQNGKNLVFLSDDLKNIEKIEEGVLGASVGAFELSIGSKSFDVVKTEVEGGISFFFLKKNLRSLVFKSFYKKYLVYFIFFLLFLMLVFYLSYFRQVFRPLEKISAYVENQESAEPLKLQTAVKEITVIAEKLQSRISNLSKTASDNKKGRVEDMTRLVASVAHELNNSLSYLGGNLTYLKEEFEDVKSLDAQECKDALSSAESGYERIKKIVSDLKVFSSAGEINLMWVSVFDFVEELKSEFQSVDFSYPQELSSFEVQIDEERLSQILKNLIKNAKEAYGEKVENQKVLVSVYEDDGFLIFSVKDWAGGFKDSVKSKVFEPFYTTKKTQGGAGLGLSLSKNLAHEMGGSLYILNTSSEGTNFCFKTRQYRLKV